jgi:hypothetical protein
MSVATIDVSGRSWTDVPNKPDKAFTPNPPPQAQGANCNWIDDDCAQLGLPGGPGGTGADGISSGRGANGGSITFQVGVINGAVRFSARGGDGGQGGAGGDGGDGSKGGRGGNGNDCEFGRMGGNGGNGGNGGRGGDGGNGGNGGSIFVQCDVDNSTNSDPLDASGGPGGRGGSGGRGGGGGAPGDQGITSGVFDSSSDCPNPGPAPGWGQNGTPGRPGTPGNGGNAGSALLRINQP